MASLFGRSKDASTGSGTPAPAPSWRSRLRGTFGTLIDKVKPITNTVLMIDDTSTGRSQRNRALARLMSSSNQPAKDKFGRDLPPPKTSFKAYRRARRSTRGGGGDGNYRGGHKAIVGKQSDDKGYADYTCFNSMSLKNPLRKLCMSICDSQHFDTFILLTILANAVVLCMMEPTKLEGRGCAAETLVSTFGTGNETIENSELVFTTIFTWEMLVKIIAMGILFEKNSYLSDGWNVMDFLVVVVSLVTLLPGSGSNVSALRVVRVLRPLRTLSVLPGMRTLIGTVIRAIPMIANVMLFCVFFFVVFGILGMQLFSGAYRNRCFFEVDETTCVDHFDNSNVLMCKQGGDVFGTSSEYNTSTFVLTSDNVDSYCATWQSEHWPGVTCDSGSQCLKYQNPTGGLVHFDDVAHAWLLIFQCITLEGWTPLMYIAMDTVSGWSVLYFVLLVFTGGFFLLNLALAVITEVYDEESAEARMEADEKEEAADVVNQPEFSSLESKEQHDKVKVQNAKRDALVQHLHVDGDSDSDDEAGGGANKNSDKKEMVSTLTRIGDAKILSIGEKVVESRYFSIFFTTCILLNTLVLAMEYDGMSDSYANGLSTVNLVLTLAFVAELVIKLLGLGIKEYFADSFNAFDALVVVISLVELGLADSGSLSALRSFRILRILKLIRSWKTLQKFLYTMGQTVLSLAEFAFVVLLAMFIFALLGMQLFGGKMCSEVDGTPPGDDSEIPRHNFDTLLWALVTVFQVLTGEDWNAVMYDAAYSSGNWSALYFVALLVIGNFLVLNLFIAILLTNFSAQEVSDDLQDTKNLLDSISFFNNLSERGVESTEELEERQKKEQFYSNLPDKEMSKTATKGWRTLAERLYEKVLEREEREQLATEQAIAAEERERAALQAADNKRKENNKKALAESSFPGGLYLWFVITFLTPRPGAAPQPLRKYTGNSFGVFSPKSVVRGFCHNVIDDQRFDAFIMTGIGVSSILMAFESPRAMENDNFADALGVADWCFTVLFTLEMLAKLIAFGVWWEDRKGTYLRDSWNVLDGSIVAVSILGKALSGSDIGWVRALRTMRVLRPLRVISRIPELRVVVNALLRSLPGLGNVLLVAGLFWLIFGILGMQMFMGAFSFCDDDGIGTKAACVDGWVNATVGVQWDSVSQTCVGWELVPDVSLNSNHSSCVGNYTSSEFVERFWLSSDGNFDSISNAMRTLFEMSTTEGWTAVMYSGVDARSPELAPERDYNPLRAFFFVVFMVVANFFIVNLFVGIILDNFAQIAEENGDGGGSATMTKEQQLWAQRKRNFFDVSDDYGMDDGLGHISDDDELQPGSPGSDVSKISETRKKRSFVTRTAKGFRKFRRKLFRSAHHERFEYFIMGVIVLNAVVMACEHYEQTDDWTNWLSGISLACTVTFILEAAIKLTAMGRKYFGSRWNLFDFFCVVTSILGVAANVGSTTSVLRVFRLARVFRLVRKLKGLRMLFNTLVISLPGLINIGALLFLLCFVFAVLGMNLFGKVQFGENLNEDANFTNFGNSILILLRMVTGEAWNSIMADAMVTDETSDCDSSSDCANGTCCGNQAAPFFFIAFVVLGSFVTLNLLIAVVVDTFSNNAKDVEGEDVTENDVVQFEKGWCRVDKNRTGYIPRILLAELIRKVPHPLGNRNMRVSRLGAVRFQKNLDITEYAPNPQSEWVYFEDALMSFTRNAMGIRTATLPESMQSEVKAELAKRAAVSFQRIKGNSVSNAESGDGSSSESDWEDVVSSVATMPVGSQRASANNPFSKK